MVLATLDNENEQETMDVPHAMMEKIAILRDRFKTMADVQKREEAVTLCKLMKAYQQRGQEQMYKLKVHFWAI